MTQNAVVIRTLPRNMAEVAVTRATACGGNCGSCESCVFENQMKTPALNRVKAKPGQKVMIESQSAKVFKAAFLVYVLPLVFFLAAYALAAAFRLSEAWCIAASFAGLIIGGAVLVLTQKYRNRNNDITFEIIEIL